MSKFHRLTEEKIKDNTYWSERYYLDLQKKMKHYELDDNKENRLFRRECKTCFYLKNDMLVTQAFTEYDCKHCESANIHHNGGVPKYCTTCSDTCGVCVRCGGKL